MAKTPSPNDLLSPQLQRELIAVAELVQSACGGEKAAVSALSGLALVRVVTGVTQQEWERYASIHALENWLALPLGVSGVEALAALMEAQERLAFQRDHDALTGLGNRGLFNRRLALELERAVRAHSELSLLMLDLDDFKKVNDTHGHDCGDTVLQQLAALLRKSVRPYDTVARIGGEEFAIILPATPSWTAHMLGKRILERFRAANIACGDHEFSMTFSAGVASVALLEGRPSAELLMKAADEALYEAKRQGKDRVLLAPQSKENKDRGSLVHSHEKQFLFSCEDGE